jgi:hypothetical protein
MQEMSAFVGRWFNQLYYQYGLPGVIAVCLGFVLLFFMVFIMLDRRR